MEYGGDQLATRNDAHMVAYAKEGIALDPARGRLNNRSIKNGPEAASKIFQRD